MEGGGVLVAEIVAYGGVLKVRDILEFVQMVKLIDNLYISAANEKAKQRGATSDG